MVDFPEPEPPAMPTKRGRSCVVIAATLMAPRAAGAFESVAGTAAEAAHLVEDRSRQNRGRRCSHAQHGPALARGVFVLGIPVETLCRRGDLVEPGVLGFVVDRDGGGFDRFYGSLLVELRQVDSRRSWSGFLRGEDDLRGGGDVLGQLIEGLDQTHPPQGVEQADRPASTEYVFQLAEREHRD